MSRKDGGAPDEAREDFVTIDKMDGNPQCHPRIKAQPVIVPHRLFQLIKAAAQPPEEEDR